MAIKRTKEMNNHRKEISAVEGKTCGLNHLEGIGRSGHRIKRKEWN